MSYSLRMIVIVILAAAFLFALHSHKESKNITIAASASGCASGQSYGSSQKTWPPDNSSIQDNQPCFKWPENYKTDRFEIQLSRNPNFDGNESTFNYLVPAACFRPEHRLAQGDWYWRVRPEHGWGWSPAWRFFQSAPLSADTTGPKIEPGSLSITNPGQALRLKVSDPSGVLTSSLKVGGIKDKAFEIVRRADQLEIRAAGGWPRGAHRLRVEAADHLGNQTSKSFWVVVAPAPPQQLQWLPRQGVSNGETREFPLGIYNVPIEGLARVKAAGFNLVHHYEWEHSPDGDRLKKYLDAVAAAGLKAFVGFDRGILSKKGLMKMDLAHLARQVAAIRDHPALLAWYLFDEPDREDQYVAPRNLKILYSLLKKLDPYHPVVVTFAMYQSIARYDEGCFDVYWIMAYGDPAQNDRTITRDLHFLGPGRPFLAILSSWDSQKTETLNNGLEVDDHGFQPNLPRMRADAYLALSHASSGLGWWWYGDNRRTYVSAGDTPEAWTWLSQVVNEIKQLSPALINSSQDLPVQVQCTPPAAARIRALKNGSQITLIAVNPSSNQETQVTIKSPLFPEQAIAAGKFGAPQTEVNDHKLSLALPPLAAQVYELKLSSGPGQN